MKNLLIPLPFAAVAAILLGIGACTAYFQYKDLTFRAYAAESHLRAAESELRTVVDGGDFGHIDRARLEFAAARQQFAHIEGEMASLGPVYDLVEAIPWAGGQARAARRLTQAGGYASEAAEEAAQAVVDLIEASKAGAGQTGTSLLFGALPTAAPRLSRALTALEMAQQEYEGLSGDGLHPLLAKSLAELQTQVPRSRGLLKGAVDALGVMPDILGRDGERVYLVLVQDSGELRPTGGFIGNYGIIRLRDGKIVDATFNDSYKADWPYYYSGKAPPVVGMFARYFPEATFWALRDSNIWPYFDRAARQAVWFAAAEGIADQVDGVIGVTDEIVNPLLNAVGPVAIPEYDVTVDASNAVDLIRRFQTSAPSEEVRKRLGVLAKDNRKLFTALLMKSVIQRLNGLELPALMKLALSLQDSFRSKAIQIYFSRPDEQRLAEAYDIGGVMKAASGDYLWVVDMNLSAAKDNLYVRPSIRYSVSVDAAGGAICELELTYDYTRQGNLYLWTIVRGYYANYLRVYVPPGSKLLAQDGTDEPVETFSEQGKTVFGSFLKVFPGTVKKVRLRYWQPLRLRFEGGKARYDLVVQRQAANEPRTFDVTVSLPESVSVDDPGSFKGEGGTLSYHGTIPHDLQLVATLVPK